MGGNTLILKYNQFFLEIWSLKNSEFWWSNQLSIPYYLNEHSEANLASLLARIWFL